MPIRWLLIFWMFAISAISFLDRVNISIAGRFIQQEFHITDLQLGNVFSAFLVGYALFQTPAGRLADRFGARLILTLGTLWWGVFTALTAMVSAGMASLFLVLLAVRFSLGAGESVLFPASNRLVANWIPSRERGLANGIIFAGVGVGAGITPPLVTHIVLHYGWRASFWISAVIGLAAGAVWYWLRPGKPRKPPLGHTARDRAHRARIARAARRTRNRQAAALARHLWKQGRPGHRVQLFHVRLRRLDLLRLVLHLPQRRARSRSQVQLLLRHASIHRHGHRLHGGRPHQRYPHAALRQPHRPLWGRRGRHRAGGGLHRLGNASGERTSRQHRAGRRRGHLVPRAQLLSVGDRRNGLRIGRLPIMVLAGGAGTLSLAQSSFRSVTADMAGASAGSVSSVMNMGGQIGGIVTASLTPLIAHQFSWTASFLVAAALCAAGSLAWLVVDPDVELGR